MSDIERIPSIRKDAKQGVPKKPRVMARPLAEREAQRAADAKPKAADIESVPSMPDMEETNPAEVDDVESVASMPEVAPRPAPTPVAEAEPEPEPEPVADVEPEPERVAAPAEPEPEPAVPANVPMSMKQLVPRVDAAWTAFRTAAHRFPQERMDERIAEDGWTRKQMLAHIAKWHDLAADRLWKFSLSGQPVELDRDADSINASVARQAIGKTIGEVLKDVEMTFNRLHRQMSKLTDAQLRAHDGWALDRVAGNTFEHYDEHLPDLYVPEPEPQGRR